MPRSPFHQQPPGRPGAGIAIAEVRDEEDLRQARLLLEEYFGSLADHLASLGLDLAATRRQEVASLPGEYAPPGGRLLLARHGVEAAGCVTLRGLPASAPIASRGAASASQPGVSPPVAGPGTSHPAEPSSASGSASGSAPDPRVCELRRLYVRPSYRGTGLGRHLSLAAIAAARAMAYDRVRLNTLPSMTRARALYVALGFREIPPYRAVLVPGVLHFELDLAEPPATSPGA
ncbi:MAG TPA: GNAT family N-acetyltransferase [Thermoanaerobaculia bacterium]|nr:GNAT family N-acetyltransferase [Thermoanaerobaculia bacterium]